MEVLGNTVGISYLLWHYLEQTCETGLGYSNFTDQITEAKKLSELPKDMHH